MKLWYQSLTRENLFHSYLGQLRRVIAAIKRPDMVIDVHGITALVKVAEMAVDMNALMGGTFVSKRLAYAPPARAQLEEIRQYYGTTVYREADA